MKKYLIISMTNLRENVMNYVVKCTYRKNPKDFSRNRKLRFEMVVFCLLDMGKRSIQLEINSFFRKFVGKYETVSKRAFNNARDKIYSDFFKDLFLENIDGFYRECTDYTTWNGYRLTAIDSTILELPNHQELREKYGFSKNQHGEVARARAVCIHDVINNVTLRCMLSKYTHAERDMAMDLISDLMKARVDKELMLFDRGYPSQAMYSFMIDRNIDFVMRASKTHSQMVKNATKKDQTVTYNESGKKYKLRIVRFKLNSGEEEILVTTLSKDRISVEELKKLYFMRWGIEVRYDELKNKFHLEDFTGINQNTIEQDFYSTIYLSNLYEYARMETEELIEKTQAFKDNKYEYKQNKNILIGTLKDELISIIFIPSDRMRNKRIEMLIKQISKYVSPIRNDRSNPRIRTAKRTKYHFNNKRCI